MPAPQAMLPAIEPARRLVAQTERFSAHNYHPMEVVLSRGEGVWVEDVRGHRYLDMLAAYSAVNFGHCAPRLVEAAKRQMGRLTLTSRAFYNDQLGPMCEALTELVGGEMVLPMNSGAEAVETAIKIARKWGARVKHVPDGRANIIVCQNNFHGRTTTIISFSSDSEARGDFGPFTPGFRHVPFGDSAALAAAIDENTIAFLVEPIQGEAGVIVPPAGYLAEVRKVCDIHRVLLIADEVQSGLGRTGATLACNHDNVRPDLLVLGKALGGGILPISAVVGAERVVGVIEPGQHGSTFGGNPLACAVASEAIAWLREGSLQTHSAELGKHMFARLRQEPLPVVQEMRGRGLWAGITLVPEAGGARRICERLRQEGILCKDTHVHTLRLAPPLVISHGELDWALDRLLAVLRAG